MTTKSIVILKPRLTLCVWNEVSNTFLLHQISELIILLFSPGPFPKFFIDIALMRLKAHKGCSVGLY